MSSLQLIAMHKHECKMQASLSDDTLIKPSITHHNIRIVIKIMNKPTVGSIMFTTSHSSLYNAPSPEKDHVDNHKKNGRQSEFLSE